MPHLPRQMIRIAALASVALAFAVRAAPVPARTFTTWDKSPGAPPPVTPELLEVGGRVFRGACLGCHGEKGNGEGREGKLLSIPPRDFTQGAFISRSTPSGSLPHSNAARRCAWGRRSIG